MPKVKGYTRAAHFADAVKVSGYDRKAAKPSGKPKAKTAKKKRK